MKNILILLLLALFSGCSSNDSHSVRRVTFKANGVYKSYEDIKVYASEDTNFEVPFYYIRIEAKSKDATEVFSVSTRRGGDYDGQATNGGAYINGKGYNYNFEHPLNLNLSINSPQRLKGTFQGVYTSIDGEDIQLTEGTIDITYYPENPYYIKQ